MGSKLTDLPDLAPSGDFALNSFLIEINDDLTDEDLEKLKFLCKGKYGIGKARLEKIQKPIDLFDILRERNLLNEMNIITLQAMLWTLPRRDLQKKYVAFAESLGSSIHFIVPKDTPENGYKYLKFHITGADLNTYDRTQLEILRSMIGNLLRVPPEFIIMTGIEPSNSLVITFMVLEEDSERLLSLTPESLSVLTSVFVNSIRVEETLISVSDDEASKQEPTAMKRIEEETRLALLRQNQTEKELEKAHEKIAELENKLKARSESNLSIMFMLAVLIQQCQEVYNNVMRIKRKMEESAFNPIDKLQKLCVFQNFRYHLQKIREKGYEVDLIYNLLDAQALVFQWHEHESKDIVIADLKMKLAFTSWQKEKLAYYHQIGVKDRIMSQRDEFFVSALLQNIPIQIQQNVTMKTPVSLECVEYLFRRLSNDVSDSDIKILVSKVDLPSRSKGQSIMSAYDYLMTMFKKHAAEYKEIDIPSFIRNVLSTPLNRMDFLQNLDRYVLEFHNSLAQPQRSTTKPGKRKSRPTAPVRKGKSWPSSRPAATSQEKPQTECLKEINERLTKMEQILERQESSSYTRNKNSMLENYEALLSPKGIFPSSYLGRKYDNLNIYD